MPDEDKWFDDVAAAAKRETDDPDSHAWVDDVVAEAKQQSRRAEGRGRQEAQDAG